MITLVYRSLFEKIELQEGEIAKSLFPVGQIYLSSMPEEIRINDEQVSLSADRTIDCGGTFRVSIRDGELWHQYSVQPIYPLIEEKDAKAYIDFNDEKKRCQVDFADMEEIDWIQFGQLHLFDRQSLEIQDNGEILRMLTECLPALQNICKRPKSHLKSINEIRPIDAVKRIGHEAIPYLAAHNEDWEARTATGLKPARLFSRTEDDDFQIYENRVVKTVIDMALRFLRQLCRDLQQTKDQLNGILMSAGVSTASFGFDLSHQKCVNSMMGRDENSEDDYEEQSNQSKKVREELKRAVHLLRRYRELKQTRLYRLLHRAKPVTGSLMPTNILRIDKKYHRVYLIWSTLMTVMHKIDTEPRIGEAGAIVTATSLNLAYKEFVQTLCGFAAHSLGFEEKGPNHFIRTADSMYVTSELQDNLILIDVGREIDYQIEIGGQIHCPIEAGTTDGVFSFDGKAIHWHKRVNDSEIELFARKLKTKESRGEQQSEENRKYTVLRQAMSKENTSKVAPHHCVIIIPVLTGLDDQTQVRYIDDMKTKATELKKQYNADLAAISLPLCRPNEQSITDYGYASAGNIAFMPISMYDINSYRRLRMTLLRYITNMEEDRCPCCGGQMSEDRSGGYICYHCSNLQMIGTICSKCNAPYKYLTYKVSADSRKKMCNELDRSDFSDESRFFRCDSLFQYKNIVPMHVDLNRISPICPFCTTEDKSS